MNSEVVIGKEYFLVSRCELSFPSKVVVKSIDGGIIWIVFDDGCRKLNDIYEFNLLSFNNIDEAMIGMAELFKGELMNVDRGAGDVYFTYLPQDKFRLIRNKMQLNIAFIENILQWFSCVDFNIDILGIKIHNGKKILAKDGKRYHCSQILLLHDIVIDMRFNSVPIKLKDYMRVMHELNPDTEFELEPSLCHSFIENARYGFNYIDLIT